jgi:Immunoglobulin domain
MWNNIRKWLYLLNHSHAMNTKVPSLCCAFMLFGGGGFAAVYYVDANNATPAPPYASWATAATNIQDAVDVSADGDEIVVTNGVYVNGGRAARGFTVNRVAVDRAVSVRSVNGPQVTIIKGQPATRCAYLTNGASLSGFTLTNGAAPASGVQGLDQSGGGVYCEFSAVVSNCVIIGNTAAWDGAGAYNGTVNNCMLIGNQAGDGGGGASLSRMNNCLVFNNSGLAGSGGGVDSGTLNNCTVVSNSAFANAGTFGCAMTNCIIYYNAGANYHESSSRVMSYCCTIPQPVYGIGNITNQPLFVDTVAGNFRLQTNSPCIDTGNNASAPAGPDLDGNPRILNGTVDMGAYEFQGTNSAIPPFIILQPTNQTASVGSNATFAVVAGGSAPLGYFWNFSGTNLPGATNSSLTLTNVQLSQAGNYFVLITNSFGSATSSIAVLTVSTGATGPPFITVQPNNQYVGVGSNATFSVTAGGSPPLSYQWRFGNTNIPGATTTSLLLTNVQASNAGVYYVVVSNSLGFAISSNAFLTFTNGPPEITVQPTNQVVGVGSNPAFYVAAGGSPLLSYQWRFSNTNIPGATRNSLLLTNVQASNAGVYYVVVSNSLGIVLSSNAFLTLSNTPPYFLSQPVSQTVTAGTNVFFNATAGGTLPLSYQWRLEGAPLAGSTNSSLILLNVQVSQSGNYSVTVTNVAGSVTSTNALLTVNPAPTFVTHHVDPNNPNPAFPYTSWLSAANNIQDAINAAANGDVVLVTNGIYATGAASNSRVAIDRAVTVQSVNGPQMTVIDGGGAVRCVSITAGASLIGFTLTNGFAYAGGGVSGSIFYTSGVVQNCIIMGNTASSAGVGGGASGCTLNNCLIAGNSAYQGGGTYFCSMNNCTVVSNTAGYSGAGGGFYSTNGTVNNTILYYNVPDNFAGIGPRAGHTDQSYCCTMPDPEAGPGNITNAPLFIDPTAGNFHLQSNSPCIDAGTNAYALGATDLDGNPRIVGVAVDIGAYEFQPSAAPFLSASLLGQNLVLSWPLWASNFTLLESSTAANSSDNWSNAPFTPFINSNGQNAVTIPADADMKFYRLRKP